MAAWFVLTAASKLFMDSRRSRVVIVKKEVDESGKSGRSESDVVL